MGRTRRPVDDGRSPLWLSRPVMNARDVHEWLAGQGVRKATRELHLTVATVRTPVDWTGLPLDDDVIEIEGSMPVGIFGWSSKGLILREERIEARMAALAAMFPAMDHGRVHRPHVTTHRGGVLPRGRYEGRITLGPERAVVFDERAARDVPHEKIADMLEATIAR